MENQKATNKLLILLFVGSFLIPATLQLGGLTLGFPRAFLLLFFVPSLFKFLSDKTIRPGLIDLFVLLFVVWVVLSLLVNHGFSRIQFVGLTVLETCGAYLFARAFLNTTVNQRFFWRVFAFSMPLILPFAIYEVLTDQRLLVQLVSGFFNGFPDLTVGYPQRLGLDRASGNFEHPILFGVFWGYGFAFVAYMFKGYFAKIFFSGVCLLMVFTSLSSGAWLFVMFQIALLMWGLVTKDAWKILLILLAIMYVVVEVMSDRSAFVALSTRLAFSSSTAYARVNIWNYGILNVWDNPFFGLGLNDWVRPFWLTPSVDNNWLLITMRHGIPALLFLTGAVLTTIFKLVARKDLDREAAILRRCFLIVLASLFFALGTVAVWSGTQAFFYTFLGMGAALATVPAKVADQATDSDELAKPASKFVYSRGSEPALAVSPGHRVEPRYRRAELVTPSNRRRKVT